MARPSPITVGVLVVTVLVLGMAVYLVSRSRHPVETTATLDQPDDWRPGPPPAPSPQVPRPEPRKSPALPALPPSPSLPPTGISSAEPPVVAVPVPAVPAAVGAPLAKALSNAAHRQQLTQEADERVFEILKMPQAQRAAIRQINDAAKNGDADRARRTALDNLLGPAAARAFETNEHSAARILLRRYRPQWAREVQEQTPLPPAPSPPSSP